MKHKLSSVTLAILSATALNVASAQETEKQVADDVEIIEVSGIRQSLTNALAEKRSADSLVEVIQAVDIGKMPDQNLAEVLENITGVQITREAGVGTGVQIRGTNANRTEINGVSTVGSGSGRTGISFEDVSASMISAVEVIKSPQAKTIEGSVGGTINLRTIRPLQLDDTLGSFRIQGEDSSLSTDGIKPRVSAAWGDNWELDSGGEFGVVLSASYAEQDVTAFRPRADRDNVVAADSGAASAQSFDFLPIQFLIQDYDNYESETMNFAGSLEWAPTSNTKFFFDAVVNDQDRRQESSRVQASGVSDLRNVSVPTEFEDVNFGVLDGQDLGSIKAALKGVIPVEDGGGDANLRFSSDTNSRQTDSQIFRLGGEWQGDDLLFSVEASTSRSNSTTPSFNTTLNFINPNVAVNDSNENGTPFEYDLSGGALAFGIAQSEANAPTSAQLLDPANVVLRDVNQGRDTTENQEDAFRADFTYYFDELIRSVDFGYRYNKSSSTSDQIRDNVGLRSMAESPTGDLFAELLVAGPDNFNAADGRSLFIKDFLLVNPELAGSNPDYVLDVLNDAIVANNAITGSDRAPISSPTSQVSAFFDIEETTHALYAQANFEYEMFRGNFGVRYLQTDITSTGNSVTIDGNGDQVVSQIVSEADYDFLLPRINIIADVAEDLIVRLGWSKDIRRPDYDDLSTSVSYSTSPNTAVAIGNPGLEPEEVTSFDISTEWYFAPSALVSVGYFHKKREDLHVTKQVDPYEDPATGFRDTTGPACEGGGTFNPIADINVFGPEPGVGVCVPTQTTVNDSDTRTQQGIELAFQYDLSSFESDLGWASGFGVMANYTYQESSGGEAIDNAISRANAVFALTTGISDIEVSAKQPLIDLSENAYNFTLYYEKYGFSARARYTWREGYRSEDFGSTSSYPWGFPVVQEDRGQLNASVSYDVNDQLNIGVEAVNLTESEVSQSCVNGGSLLCYQGLTDRRITFGVSYRF
ncbi:TonB-dependent receptor [Pseudoalteromonas haloplanktis]|uniref:TonB-dependent receptor n=1 Tax=Pseudoalteromonas haloplanktis TaxID=228 RepID=A0ABU1B8R1_PSEHA|nr:MULTISPECIES: TonB-dependent receptor [Pseudoalteromonas]MDQ9090324.1 TonB-dependent receptor [Pseudoalteromonas haloplanktis]TMN71654.1 TonB-dependent receptor [Pseudoalteromonas sp. S1727]